MSRHYRMNITIRDYNKEKIPDITDAVEEIWEEAETKYQDENELFYGAEGWLCGGEGEEEFTRRLAKAVFEANGAPCDVEVGAVYLDDLPCEIHRIGPEQDKDEVDEIMQEIEDEKEDE